MCNVEVQTSDELLFPIDAILKRRNDNEAGELSMKQLGLASLSMIYTLVIMDDQSTEESIKILSYSIIDICNKYAVIKIKNMLKFIYWREIIEGIKESKLKALD